MKKFIFSVVCLSIASFMFYCTKSEKSTFDGSNVKEQSLVEAKTALKVSSDPVNSTCPCSPGFATCSSDCMFSDCCVCWDPKKETGACGCYFGVAKCLTDLINKPAGGDAARTVKLYHVKFKEQIKYLNSIGGDTKRLKEIVDGLTVKSKFGKDAKKGDFIEADGASYQLFFEAYKNCIESFDNSKKD
jgi:hypothetical protein